MDATDKSRGAFNSNRGFDRERNSSTEPEQGAPCTRASIGMPDGISRNDRVYAALPVAAPGDSDGAVASDSEAPEWIELLPVGSFSRRDDGKRFRLDDPQAVIQATEALQMDAGLPIDYDHSTDLAAPEGRPAPAAGWIVGLQARTGAIWGRIEWTRQGAAAIRSRQYRYISPVFQHSADGRVIRILRAALTNNPALHLTAIAAGGSMSEDKDKEGAEEMSASEFQHRAAEILGRSADASRAELLEAARRTRGAHRAHHESAGAADAHEQADDFASPFAQTDSAAGPDGAIAANAVRFVPIAEFEALQTSFNTLKTERARERAERAVDEAIRSSRLIPAQREWAIGYCVASPSGFAAFATRQPAMLNHCIDTPFAGAPANRSQVEALSEAEISVCVHLGIRRDDFIQHKSEAQASA